MSFGIYYEPHKPPKGTQLPTGLKYAIGERYLGSTSLRGADAFFDGTHIPYLLGLIDASGNGDEVEEGARELIRAIEQHGTVRVWVGEADD